MILKVSRWKKSSSLYFRCNLESLVYLHFTACSLLSNGIQLFLESPVQFATSRVTGSQTLLKKALWPCSLTLNDDVCQSLCHSDSLSPAPWLCSVEGNDWEIIHCRIMTVQQRKCQRLSIDCQTEQSASVCVDDGLASRMTVWKSWKCLWLHLNIIWSSFRLNLVQSTR